MEGHFDPAWGLDHHDRQAVTDGENSGPPVEDPLAFLSDPGSYHNVLVDGHDAHGVKLDNGTFCLWDETCHAPSFCEALLETDNFLQNFGIGDSPSGSIKAESDMEVSDRASQGPNDLSRFSSAESLSTVSSERSPEASVFPSGGDPFRNAGGPAFSFDPRGETSRDHRRGAWATPAPSAKYATHSYRAGAKPQSRHFAPGLEPIPENDVARNGFSSAQPGSGPHVSLPVAPPRPVTSTYNISFPTSSAQFGQKGHRHDPWRTGGFGSHKPASPGAAASPASGYVYSCSSNSSPGSLASPFHGACQTSSTDLSEFQPLNFVHSDGTTTRYNLPSRNLSGEKVSNKASKRSYLGEGDKEDVASDILNPISDSNDDDQGDGASFRQRKKSAPNLNDTKRKNFIKDGIEELQRIIPHFGMSKNEKVSQASVLSEAAKLIQSLRNGQDLLADQIQKVKCNIDELNKQIEVFQSQLPDTGAPYLPPRALASRPMESLFHDHVSDKTLEQWQYWIFTIILGHFVHSFEDQVSTNSFAELEATSQEWIANSMTLQQLRKDVYRKLAKLCVKTSIVDDPSKLPEEAIAYATHRMRGNRKKPWFTELPLT